MKKEVNEPHQLKGHSEFLRLYVHIWGHHNFSAKRLHVIHLLLEADTTPEGEGLHMQSIILQCFESKGCKMMLLVCLHFKPFTLCGSISL